MQYIGAVTQIYAGGQKEQKENLCPLGGSRKITLQRSQDVRTGQLFSLQKENTVGFEL